MQAGSESDLVATKLTAPTLPTQLIDRPRLDGVLDAAVADPTVRVVLVSAPAGSGKSTLVAGWQATRDDCAWLQADPADRDPARFWGHLIGAMGGLVPDIAETVGPAVSTELYVSLNTVKTHCRAIYRKLGTGDRKAAVQAARDSGLL